MGLLLVAFCALVWLRAAHPIENPDFGWHVAMGRWIVEHGAVPDREPFTHTALGQPMVAHQWLSQWLYAVVIEGLGVRGLRFAHAFLAVALVLLLYQWLRRDGVAGPLALLGTVVWVAVAESRFQHRPHVLNLLFFLLAYGLLFSVRPRLSRAQLLGFFALVVLWVNLHSGAVLFAAVVALYAAVASVEQLALGRPPHSDEPGEGRLGRLWVLAALVAAALVVSPNHFRIISYVLESGQINPGLSFEWFSLASSRGIAAHGWLFFCCFAALTAAVAGLAILSLAGRAAPVAPARLAVVLVVASLPFVSQRFTWTSFVSVLFAFGMLSAALGVGSTATGSQWRGARLRIGAIALALVLAGVSLGAELQPARVGHVLSRWGNFRNATFPVGAMTFLDAVGLEGRLFNGVQWGGYVLFRTQERYPVFVDGRWVTIGESVVRDAHAITHRRPGHRALLDRYEIEILLVRRGWMTAEIEAEGAWLPVFENFNAGVYLRPGRAFEKNLERCRAYYETRGIPFDARMGFDEERAMLAAPRWARALHVQRIHLDQFGATAACAADPPRPVRCYPARAEGTARTRLVALHAEKSRLRVRREWFPADPRSSAVSARLSTVFLTRLAPPVSRRFRRESCEWLRTHGRRGRNESRERDRLRDPLPDGHTLTRERKKAARKWAPPAIFFGFRSPRISTRVLSGPSAPVMAQPCGCGCRRRCELPKSPMNSVKHRSESSWPRATCREVSARTRPGEVPSSCSSSFRCSGTSSQRSISG